MARQPAPGDAVPNPQINDFLNPASMVTPGAIGAIVTVCTASLAAVIELSEPKHIGITCLILSFLFGIVAIIKDNNIFQRAMFYVINSLIIFSMAAGTNEILSKIERNHAQKQVQQKLQNEKPNSPQGFIFGTPAFAADSHSPLVHKAQFFKPLFSSDQSTAEKKWNVYVGSYFLSSNAERKLQGMRRTYQNLDPRIVVVADWSTIQVGGDMNLGDAVSLYQKLHSEDISSVILLRLAK